MAERGEALSADGADFADLLGFCGGRALASKHHDSLVIIDERLGRNVAEYMGLPVTGTLGVLAKAKTRGLIPSFYAAAQGMREQGIYYSEGLIARLAQHLGEINH